MVATTMRRPANAVVVGTLLGFAAMSGLATAEQVRPSKVDPKADALLRKMSADMANLKAFRFDAEHVSEVVTQEGQKIQVLASSTVTVQRPGKLRSDRKGRYGDVTLFYDGRKLTVYGKRENLYATATAPETLDKTIDFARNELGLEAPAADLLYANPYAALMEDVVSGTYIDDAFIDGRVCHHLAYRGNETDWEIWIEDGPRALPCRFVITSKKVTGAPEYAVELRNWQIDTPIPDTQFTFTPPRDAGRIEFWNAAKRQQEQPRRGPS
jgi:hypothetical protein